MLYNAKEIYKEYICYNEVYFYLYYLYLGYNIIFLNYFSY